MDWVRRVNWRPITKVIVIATAVIWASYDVLPFLNPSRRDTISEVIIHYALNMFSLPFAFGTLMGHFMWPWEGHHPKPKVLFPTLGAFIAIDCFVYFTDNRLSQLLAQAQGYPIFLFLVSIIFGHFFWPQQKTENK